MQSGGLPIQNSIFGFQSWYFGYVLAFVFVLAVFFFVRMSKHKKQHWLIWMPVLLMLAVCTGMKITDEKCLAYVRKYSYMESDMYRSSISNSSPTNFVYYVVKDLEVASLRRWVDAAWKYMAAAVLMSAAAVPIFRLSLKRSKTAVTGVCTVVLAALLLACAADRTLAVSAKLLFQPYKNQSDETFLKLRESTFYKDYEGDPVWGSGGFSGQESEFEDKFTYICAKKIPVYAEPDTDSEVVFCFQKGDELRCMELRSLNIPSETGWRYGKHIYCSRESYDENGYRKFIHRGYIRIENVVHACGPGSGNGWGGILARQEATKVDVLSYRWGMAVSPSIMYAFAPLEIYLLAPLTAAAALLRIFMLAKGYRRKRRVRREKPSETKI